MKIKMCDALNVDAAINSLREQVISVKTGYKLAKINNSLNESINYYYQSLHTLGEKYSERDVDGRPRLTEDGNYLIQNDKLAFCQSEITDLLALEVDCADCTFTTDELDGLNLSLDQINALIPFINE